MAWQSPRNRCAPSWCTAKLMLLPGVTSCTSRLPPWTPLSMVSTAPCTGATPATPIIGRTGSFSRSLQWITPFSTRTTRFWMPNSFCRTQSGNMPMPGQSAVKPRPSSAMSWTRTVSMSPGLAPITRIGPVAGLTNGSLMSSAVSFLSSDVITPALQLISASTSNTSPGRTSAMKGSLADRAYLRLPSLATVWLGMARFPPSIGPALTADRGARGSAGARSCRR